MIVNPETLKHVIDRQLVYGTSRAMIEEVRFDENMVNSVDWLTYPVLHIDTLPENIEIVLIRKLRRVNRDRSTTGCFSVSSQIRKIVKPTTATMANVMICPDPNQSRSLPLSSMTCRAPTHNTSRNKPILSIGRLMVGVSRDL